MNIKGAEIGNRVGKINDTDGMSNIRVRVRFSSISESYHCCNVYENVTQGCRIMHHYQYHLQHTLHHCTKALGSSDLSLYFSLQLDNDPKRTATGMKSYLQQYHERQMVRPPLGHEFVIKESLWDCINM